jgi:ABC-type nitrate/sulfonate/bicarbonate transport system substrate-binding protein
MQTSRTDQESEYARICQRIIQVVAGLLLALETAGSVATADKIRVGKSVTQPFAFAPIEIGLEKGIWGRHGLELEVSIFAGDAKLQQALVATSVDFGLGSGPAMGFLVKGVPAKAVGVIANQPLSMGIVVGPSSAIRTPGDLKGAKIGISTEGSLTQWLARELSRRMGWGSDGIQTVALGAISAQFAALRRSQVDGFVMSSSQGYLLEKHREGRLLLEFGDYIKDFHTHVVFATTDVIQKRPDQVRRFLSGWIDVIAFMEGNKDETVRIARRVTGLDEDVERREYDEVMPMMSREMRFSPKALDIIGDSFPELQILPTKPDMTALFTEEFLPK